MHATEPILATRLGINVHASPLRFKIRRLMEKYPLPEVRCMEDWLLDIANVRGVTAITRPTGYRPESTVTPSLREFSNAELVTAICQPHNRDRPQWFRAAHELIAAGKTDLDELERLAGTERVSRILYSLSIPALRAEPANVHWHTVHGFCSSDSRPLRDNLVHWSRLAKKRSSHAASAAPIHKTRG